MPYYSQKSKDKLSTCQNDLQIIFNEVIKYFDNTILDGHRGKERQDKAYREGFSKVQYPNSKHNDCPSLACDSVPYPIDWKDINRMRYYAGFVVGTSWTLYHQGIISHVLRTGFDWDKDTELSDNRWNDAPHFELYKPN